MADPARLTSSLGGEEVDGLGDRDRVDVLGLEAEGAYQGDDLALEFRVLQLAREDAAHGHLAGGGDGELEYQFALQLGVLARGARVQAVEMTVVAVEHQLDLLARARRPA